jgi:hypothetical protein
MFERFLDLNIFQIRIFLKSEQFLNLNIKKNQNETNQSEHKKKRLAIEWAGGPAHNAAHLGGAQLAPALKRQLGAPGYQGSIFNPTKISTKFLSSANPNSPDPSTEAKYLSECRKG